MWNPFQHLSFPSEFSNFLKSQFTHLPYPTTTFSGQTIIVTGANTGLGLETAKHFARLGAAKVILACRSVEKGEVAKQGFEAPPGVVEVWQVDLSSYGSVKAFCARAQKLERLDVLIENAGVMLPRYEETESMETTITVNVISTSLMAMLLLPKLQADGARNNMTPHLVVVGSNSHAEAKFKEQDFPSIFEALRSPINQKDRYNTAKLLQLLIVRELASVITGLREPSVILNIVEPGFCQSELMRHSDLLLSVLVWLGGKMIGRTCEQGSRTIMKSAVAGFESQGTYMVDCEVSEPSAWVRSEKGKEIQKKVFKELLGILEGIEPGVTKGFETTRDL